MALVVTHSFVATGSETSGAEAAGKVVTSKWNENHAIDTNGVEFPDLPSAAAGTYTLANSGMVFKDAGGNEIWRIWGTDPDGGNFNSHNLYIGLEAGLNAATNNTAAGYQNIGIGAETMGSVTTGTSNTICLLYTSDAA